MSARHRVSKLLLRQRIVYSGGKAWTGVRDTWLRQQRFELAGLQMAYDSAYETMLATTARRDRFDKAIAVMAADSPFTPVTRRLGCLRGVSTLTAFSLAVEIGDWQRLSGRSIGAYLGMTPTEYASGQSRSQGGITKTGNGHAHRLLIEAARHHRAPYRAAGLELRRRWDRAPALAATRGHAGNRRLHQRWQNFIDRKKSPVIANAAIARELTGRWPCSRTDPHRCPSGPLMMTAA